MKIAKILSGGKPTYAKYENGKYYIINGDIYGQFAVGEEVSCEQLLCPCCPRKIVAIGVNYAEHAKEMNRDVMPIPAVFFKPTTALLEPYGKIIYPSIATLVHYEGELAVVIGKKCKKVSKENALDYVFGYTCANDVTERKIQKSDLQWTRGKGFDTFCPLGTYITTDVDVSAVRIQSIKNGEIVQDGNTADLLYNVPALIEFVSQFTTLEVGDVILTGTPKGVGELNVGDTITVRIEGLGELTNTVTADLDK